MPTFGFGDGLRGAVHCAGEGVRSGSLEGRGDVAVGICGNREACVAQTFLYDLQMPRERFRAYRDRALIYLLGDTPSRRAELAGLGVSDLNLDGAVVVVIGKGRRDRSMPLGSAVCDVPQGISAGAG